MPGATYENIVEEIRKVEEKVKGKVDYRARYAELYELDYTKCDFKNKKLQDSMRAISEYVEARKNGENALGLVRACRLCFEGLDESDKLSKEDSLEVCRILFFIARNRLNKPIIDKLAANYDKYVNDENAECFEMLIIAASYDALYENWGRITYRRWMNLYKLIFEDKFKAASEYAEEMALRDKIGSRLRFAFGRGDGDQTNGAEDYAFPWKFDNPETWGLRLANVIRLKLKTLNGLHWLTRWISHAEKMADETYSGSNVLGVLDICWYIVETIANCVGVEIINQSSEVLLQDGENKAWFMDFLYRKNINFPNCIDDLLDEIDSEEDNDVISLVKKLALVYTEAHNIKECLKVNSPEKLMYYTTYETLMYMLPHADKSISDSQLKREEEKLLDSENDGCIKWSFMNVEYMNDPKEGKTAKSFFGMSDEPHEIGGCNEIMVSDVYLKSFTQRREDLSMWEMYGGHAEGCFISVDWKSTKRRNKNVPDLYAVLYLTKGRNNGEFSFDKKANSHIDKNGDAIDTIKDNMIKLKELIDTETNPEIKEKLFRGTECLWFLIKDSKYYHEKESRILFDDVDDDDGELRYTGGDVPKVYVRGDFTLTIQEIIFGPKCKNVGEKALFLSKQFKELRKKYRTRMPKILMSSIEYR